MDKKGRILNGSFHLVEIVTITVTRVLIILGLSVDYLSEPGRFSIMRPYMPTKQGYQYIMANNRLFVFRKGIIEFFRAILVCLC
jgi:hypothetical protein